MNDYLSQQNGTVPSVCPLDCPDQCGLLIQKEAGRIVKIGGDPNHPVTRGAICNKVRNMAERIYDEKRLQFPMKRVGPKGSRQFEQISWEEAIGTITDRWKALIGSYGAESILPYSFYGNMGLIGTEGLDRRFFHRLGSSRLGYSICSAAGVKGYAYTMGASMGTDPEDTVHAKLIIFWGINAVSTNMHQMVFAEQARKNGAQIVVIDVHRNQTGRSADWFIPILPGTDAALALGIMHILFAEGLEDQEFLEAYTVGHRELREHVRAYNPILVSEITGVPVEDIYRLARLYGSTVPAFIRIGNGIQHHDNGGMCVRTIACLPAITGQWQHLGGGAIKGNSGYMDFNEASLQRPDLLLESTRKVNMNLIGAALTELDPPIRSLYVYNSNPAIVAPRTNLVRKGLAREDLFTVVHDLFLTETAAYADIVLPATSSFENTDLYMSYWHHYSQIQQPVIAPYAGSKSNVDVFRLLAAAMGFEEQAFKDTEAEMIAQALDNPDNPHLRGVTYESLVEKQFVKGRTQTILDNPLKTPSGKIELYSKRMQLHGYPPLPAYIPLPVDEYPFYFVPAPNHNFLNSTFSNNDKHVRMEKTMKLHMHVQDAARLGIAGGDCVRIWNDGGECELTAAVGEDVLPGVLVSQGLWADAEGKKFLVNALAPDRVADMGDGATFFSGRVDAELVRR